MAVTGRRVPIAAIMLSCVMISGVHLSADDSADVHQVVSGVATALASGNPALAMSAFGKSYPSYATLSSDFDALTAAYYVESQVEFTDEYISASTATVTVHWDITLTTLQTGFTKNRNADITLKLAREGKHWRIVTFGPIDIFDPASS